MWLIILATLQVYLWIWDRRYTPLNINSVKSFSFYKQVFILTRWSYSDVCTINTSKNSGKFRQMIVFLHNVEFLRVTRRKLDKIIRMFTLDAGHIINYSWNGHPWLSLGMAQNAEKTPTKPPVKRKISIKHLQLFFSSLAFLNHLWPKFSLVLTVLFSSHFVETCKMPLLYTDVNSNVCG